MLLLALVVFYLTLIIFTCVSSFLKTPMTMERQAGAPIRIHAVDWGSFNGGERCFSEPCTCQGARTVRSLWEAPGSLSIRSPCAEHHEEKTKQGVRGRFEKARVGTVGVSAAAAFHIPGQRHHSCRRLVIWGSHGSRLVSFS